MARLRPEQLSLGESQSVCILLLSDSRAKPRAIVDALSDIQKLLEKLRLWEGNPELSPAHPIKQLEMWHQTRP